MFAAYSTTCQSLSKQEQSHYRGFQNAESAIVCVGPSAPHGKSLRLFLTPDHVGSEVKVCCRDYYCHRRSYWLRNIRGWCVQHDFFYILELCTQCWPRKWCHRPFMWYTIGKLSKRGICSISPKSGSECCEKRYWRSSKFDENHDFFVTKGGATVLQLNWYHMMYQIMYIFTGWISLQQCIRRIRTKKCSSLALTW